MQRLMLHILFWQQEGETMMHDSNILKELTIDDLPEPYKTYAKAIGIDNLITLSDSIGGKTIYMPTKDSLILMASKKKVYQEYLAGSSVKSIAEKYRISIDSVYRYIKHYKNTGDI